MRRARIAHCENRLNATEKESADEQPACWRRGNQIGPFAAAGKSSGSAAEAQDPQGRQSLVAESRESFPDPTTRGQLALG